MKYILMFITLFSILSTGCVKQVQPQYSPKDFINPNRVVTKNIPLHLPSMKVHATFGHGNDPSVIKAYQQFTKKGLAKDVLSPALRTIAYDPYSQPILACSPLHLCVVQLEQDEQVNDIELGDASHWMWARSLVGTAAKGSDQVSIKPKLYDIATDMLITTNKRTYNIGLVSKQGMKTQVVTFYYPQETRMAALSQLHDAQVAQHSIIFSKSTAVNMNQLNFNYRLKGDSPVWKPIHVFDDGNKTFIEMPPIAERFNLPVLYIYRNQKMQLVNYRYRRPYYIVDALFQKAYLISGKGSQQVRVDIVNQNFHKRGLI